MIITGNIAAAYSGVFNFSNCLIIAKPGSSINLKLTINELTTYNNDISFLKFPFEFKVETRTCRLGEEYTKDGRCLQCSKDYYIFSAPTSYSPCKECDSNAACYGGFIVAPKKGFWRSTNTTEEISACPKASSCLGGD